MPHTLWLVRHANRQDFIDPEWYKTAASPYDPGLSPDGAEQAQKLARRLAGSDIEHIVASPFLRTIQTARPVADVLDLPMLLEPGLGEWLNADWFSEAPTLLGPDALAERFPRTDLNYVPCLRPSFPETRTAMFERVGETVQCLVHRYDEVDEVLLVGHGATVQGALRTLIGDPEDVGCPLASVTEVMRRDGTWQIVMRNDTSHLEETEAPHRFH